MLPSSGYRQPGVHTPYTYRVVTSCGAGVHGGERLHLREAVEGVRELRTDPRPVYRYENAEVERILHLDYGRRYWLWRAGGWKAYGAKEWHERIHNPTTADLAHWDAA